MHLLLTQMRFKCIHLIAILKLIILLWIKTATNVCKALYEYVTVYMFFTLSWVCDDWSFYVQPSHEVTKSVLRFYSNLLTGGILVGFQRAGSTSDIWQNSCCCTKDKLNSPSCHVTPQRASLHTSISIGFLLLVKLWIYLPLWKKGSLRG